MSNVDGNPKIAALGASTRFGQPGGPDPGLMAREKNPAHVRAVLRRLAACEIDITQPVTIELLSKMLRRDGSMLTGAEMLAVRKWQQAMTNWRAMDSLIDAIDGKQVQKQVEAQATLADLINRSYELETE